MKLIADVMLGRLAKRLRLLGFDVLYDRSLDDNGIIRLSLEQGRVILTRDTGLVSRPLAKAHIFVTSDRISEQLKEVLDRLSENPPTPPSVKGGQRVDLRTGGKGGFEPVEKPAPLTRCCLCNQPLKSMPKREVKDLVPEHVYATKKDFFKCTGCGKIYWKGTHVRRMGRNR